MKNYRVLTLGLSLFFVATISVFGQQEVTKRTTVKKIARLKIDKSKVKVQRHTVLSKFEPSIASSEEERMQKKQERIAETERKLQVLDTLNISERKRRLLLRDLKYSPYSTRLNKATLTNNLFEDTSDNQEE